MDGCCRWIVFVIFIIIYSYQNAEEIGEFRNCGDEQCKEPIAEGRTLIRYFTHDKKILSFQQNEVVIIYSKGGGLKKELWEGEINGKRGFLPARFIRETKILKKNLIAVPLEEESIENSTLDSNQNDSKNELLPSDENDGIQTDSIRSTETSVNKNNESEQSDILSSRHVDFSASDLPTKVTKIESSSNNVWFPSEEKSILSLPWASVTAISKTISLHADKFSSTLFKGLLVNAQNIPHSDISVEISNEENATDGFASEPTGKKEDLGESISDETDSALLISSSFNPSIAATSGSQQDTPYISESPKNIKTSATTERPSTLIVAKETAKDYRTSVTDNPKNEGDMFNEEIFNPSDKSSHEDHESLKSSSVISNKLAATDEKQPDDHEVAYNNDNNHEDSEKTNPQSVSGFKETQNAEEQMLFDNDKSKLEENNYSEEQDVENSSYYDENEDDEDDEDEQEDEVTIEEEDDFSFVKNDSEDTESDKIKSPSDRSQNITENLDSVENEKGLKSDEVTDAVENTVSDDKLVNQKMDKFSEMFSDAKESSSQGMTDQASNLLSEDLKSKDNFMLDKDISLEKNTVVATSFGESANGRIAESSLPPPINVVDKDTRESKLFSHTEPCETCSATEPHGTSQIQDQSVKIDQLEDETIKPTQTESTIAATQQSSFTDDVLNGVEQFIDESRKEDDVFVQETSNESTESDSVLTKLGEIFESITAFSFGLNSIKLTVDAIRPYVQLIIDLLPSFMQHYVMELEEQGLSPRVLVFTFISGYFMLLLLVSFYLIKRNSKENSLTARLCKLDKELFEAATERDVLKDELKTSKLTMNNIDHSLIAGQDTINSLEMELERSKKESHKLQETVVLLKDQLNQQTDAVKNLQTCIETKNEQYSNLEESHEEAQTRISNLKNQINQMQDTIKENEDKNAELLSELNIFQTQVSCLQESNSQLLQEAEIWNQRVEELQQQLQIYQKSNTELEESISLKEGEVKVLHECMLQLKIIQDESTDDSSESAMKKLEKLMEVSQVRLDLKRVSEENSNLDVKLKAEEDLRKTLEERLITSNNQIESMSLTNNTLQQERDEAQTRLQILTNYFKEKEIELQRELGVQEAKRQETQESATSISQRAASYEEEIALYKSQIESLKKEIESQSKSFKNQISLLENKVHDNWLAARAAERRTEEAKQEAAVLRNKLTLSGHEREMRNRPHDDDVAKSTPKGYPGSNGEIPSPAQLDSDSVDLPVSGPLPLLREPLDHPPLNFLPQDRPLPPPPFGLPLPFLPQDRRQPHPPLPPMFGGPPPPVHPFETYRRPSPFQMLPRGIDFRMPPPLLRERHSPPHSRVSPPFDQNSPPPRDYHSPPPDRRNFPDRYSSPPLFDRRPPTGRRLSPTHSPYDRSHPIPHERESHITPPPRFPLNRTYERFPPSSQLGIRPLLPLRREVASDSQKGDSSDHPRSSSSFSVDPQDETITAV